jgi:hypothetical protein
MTSSISYYLNFIPFEMTSSWVFSPCPEAHYNLCSVITVNGWISSPALNASRLKVYFFQHNCDTIAAPF